MEEEKEEKEEKDEEDKEEEKEEKKEKKEKKEERANFRSTLLDSIPPLTHCQRMIISDLSSSVLEMTIG